MAEGIVIWFNDSKGLGLIDQNDGNTVLVHHSGILADGIKSLKEGDRVQFDVDVGPKGRLATNVVKC